MQRRITAAQNRILKSFFGLAALDQHERWISQTQQSIEVQTSQLVESISKDEGDAESRG